jgi:hypothetical protein
VSGDAVAWLRKQIEWDLSRWREREASCLPDVEREGEWLYFQARERVTRCEAELAILNVHMPPHYCPLPVLPSTHGQLWTPSEGPCWTLHLLAGGYKHHPGYRKAWKP